jgi:hypothetical protein
MAFTGRILRKFIKVVSETVLNTDNAGLKISADNATSNQVELSAGTPTANRTVTLPDATGTVTLNDATQSLSNKDLQDSTVAFVDNSDSTKKVKLEVSGVTTATTRTLTVPDADLTLVGIATTQTLTNKTIDADQNTITNIENADIKAAAAIDATKIANGTVDNTEFQRLNGVTDTIVSISATQTLTNKSIDADQNTITNIENADIKAAAAIDATKIADGSVNNTKFQYINSLTSNAQTQLDAKIANSLVDAKGDLITATADNTPARLAVGSDGNVLTADSTQATGIRWAAPSASPTSSNEISNLGLATSVGSNALTIALKQADGTSDPASGSGAVKVGIRSSTLTSGAYNQRSVTSATSLVISSGSTLGQTNGQASDIYVYLLDNAGTLELAASGTRYSENALISTTAEGGAGAADSRTTIYSTTARSNVPIRLIGIITNTQTTAGTWASAGTVLTVGSFGTLRTKMSPTIQVFNTSGSGTYNTPAGVLYLKVRAVGGGGKGGGGGNANGAGQSAGQAGTATTFGPSLITANGGSGGSAGNTGGSEPAGGNGGTTTALGSGAIGFTIAGSRGAFGWNNLGGVTGMYTPGGEGGNSVFGGGGNGTFASTGAAAATSSGSGGQGGGVPGLGVSGGGGGAGAYVDAIIPTPSSSYSYTVGAGGTTGGAAGTGGSAGGNGADGIIIVEEYYA